MDKISAEFPFAPSSILQVKYGNIVVSPGTQLAPMQVSTQPCVHLLAKTDSYYTLVFFDPDVSMVTKLASKIHWLVVNIPGNQVSAGTEIFHYIGAMPQKLANMQRYVICVFKQPSMLKFNEISDIEYKKFTDRETFMLAKFAKEHNFEGPVAGNFFRSQYDINVPSLYARLFDRYDDLGQEDGVATQDGEVKLTPFNMKEELEEGHFDTEGNFHWDKEKLIKDHWLDNIDWVKLKDNKEAVVKSDDDDDSMELKPESPFDDRSIYRQILAFMEPGETVARTLRRLGGGASLSASERLKRRKAGLSVDPGGDSGKVTQLTELANRILTKTGNMDIYQESFAYIKNRTEQSSSKESKPELDMYADDFDSKEKERVEHNEADSLTNTEPDEKEPPLMWEYKEDKTSDDVKGPFTSEQMQITASKLKIEFWVRKVGMDSAFYSSKRVDFDLYT